MVQAEKREKEKEKINKGVMMEIVKEEIVKVENALTLKLFHLCNVLGEKLEKENLETHSQIQGLGKKLEKETKDLKTDILAAMQKLTTDLETRSQIKDNEATN